MLPIDRLKQIHPDLRNISIEMVFKEGTLYNIELDYFFGDSEIPCCCRGFHGETRNLMDKIEENVWNSLVNSENEE